MTRPNRAIQRYLAVIIVSLTLVACSRVELAYENADWLGAWQIGDYLDLTTEQRDRLRDGLAAYQQYHRQNRLPDINAYLDRVDTVLATPEPEKADVDALFIDGEQIVRTNVTDVIPLAAELLRELDAGQIEALQATLAEGRETYIERLLVDQEQRAIERTQDWVGPLEISQRTQLTECVAAMPDVSEEWQAWRRQTEEDLITLLHNDAPQAEVESFLQGWLLEDAARSPVLQDYRQTSRALWRRCTHRLLTTLTPMQRAQARERLAGYRGDLETVASR
ncbi:DUF6279 family lipoprotein [Spiribacter sp. 221]|uniref:DUF6279 family lipoprotein n=1 Tax=Spiribacter onubensis TaxID=3122420 RepID=UPI00349FC001